MSMDKPFDSVGNIFRDHAKDCDQCRMTPSEPCDIGRTLNSQLQRGPIAAVSGTVIAPVSSLFEIPVGATCQEASTMSGNRYFPCGKPAEAIIESSRSATEDSRAFYMCMSCAMHNLRNRNAAVIFTTDGVLRKMMKDRVVKVKVITRPAQKETPPAPVFEGWALPSGGRKQHYFRSEMSLCGQWAKPAEALLTDTAMEGSACSACAEQLVMLKR